MANRRMAQFAEIYLRHMLQQRQDEKQGEIQRQNQAALAGLQASNQQALSSQRAAEGLLPRVQSDPGLASSLMRGGTSELAGIDISPFAEDSFAPELKQITEAGSLADLPSPQAQIMQRIARRGAPMRSLDEVRQMIEANQAQDARLRSVMDPTKVESVDPDSGLKQTEFVSSDPEQLTGRTFSTEATPQQAGLNAGNQKLAELQTPGLTEGQIAEGNQLEAGLRGGKALTAGAVGRASGYGSRAGNIGASFDNLDKLRQVEAVTNPAISNPTGGERLAAGQLQPLINAHAMLRKLEDAGGGLTAGATTVVGNPMMSNNPVTKRFYAPEELEYAQAGVEWSNIAGKIISGVAVREDEKTSFYGAMIPNKNDPPQLKLQKQNARESFVQVAQAAAGRSKPEAGQMLGRAVKSGNLDIAILKSLQLDPEVNAGFVTEMGR